MWTMVLLAIIALIAIGLPLSKSLIGDNHPIAMFGAFVLCGAAAGMMVGAYTIRRLRPMIAGLEVTTQRITQREAIMGQARIFSRARIAFFGLLSLALLARNLEAAGIPHSSISIAASNADNWYSPNDRTAPSTYPDRDLDGKDDRAEAAGAGVGATVGTTVGVLTGLGIIAIPGLGSLVAAGWLATALTGLAAGAATGGIVGALTQAGVSSDEAEVYAESLRRGGAVVSVKVDEADRSRVQALLDRGAVRVSDRAAAYRKAGWKSFDPNATAYTADQIRKERELYR
jgi:hypothetical protein